MTERQKIGRDGTGQTDLNRDISRIRINLDTDRKRERVRMDRDRPRQTELDKDIHCHTVVYGVTEIVRDRGRRI